MEIKIEPTGQVIVLRLKGNILAGADANSIHQIIHEELEKGNRFFVLDMAEVSLINSTGVGILIGALTAARNQEGEVKLASISDKVRHILSMMNLNQVFGIYETVELACESYL